jgi:hypothetical protein
MWIRSQDKRNLTNGKITFKLMGRDKCSINIFGCLVEYYETLADYSSLEKGFKVMDLIEKRINIRYNDKIELIKCVCQLPQDDEVEV